MVASNVATAGVALFPFLLTSSYNPNHSFTVWDSTSSHLTLWWMTMAAVLFVPLILAYTSWAFHKMRDIIRTEDIDDAERRVIAAGGVITREQFDFPGGRRFHFREPGGNELAVWVPRAE
jgi:protein-S-isoprenylcysteine O-methyltransferase Ste14